MKETILVVDDNRQVAGFMAERILPSLGFEAVVAHDGSAAFSIIKTRSISLMLLDFQLPDTTGLEFLRQLGVSGYSVPTILITAHGSEQIVAEAFRLGVQDYLNKPVDASSLEIAITRALTESRLRREKLRLTAQLNEQVSWLKVLTKVGQSVTSTLDLDEVLRRIVEASVYLTRAEEGFLALLDEENGQLALRAVKNIEQEKSKILHLPVNDSLIGKVVQTSRPLRMAQSDSGTSLKVSTGFLVYAFLHVPLLSRGKVLGVLSVDNRTARRAFIDSDEVMLTSLADYATVAIENANLYHRSQQELAERQKVEEALRKSEERYSLAVRGASDGLWDWDLKTNRVYFSPRWKQLLGYPEGEIGAGLNEWFNRIHPEDVEQAKLDITNHIRGLTSHFENEHRMLHKDGAYRWMLSRGLAVWSDDGVAKRMAGSMTDTTDRKVAEQRLQHDALHDTLTALPNRALFMDRLNLAVERAKRREGYLFAVLFLDLDRFKDINDSLGHMVGDKLLVAVARMLEQNLRPTDTVARLGGDEFVILLEDINDIDDATYVADRIQKEVGICFTLDDRPVFISVSIGIVLSLTGYSRHEDVLRDADIAMYRAKANGKARYEIFDPAMRSRIMERISMEAELRRALENEELRVYYQPIVSLETSRVIGFEALVRWQHPTQGLLLPADFISLAEDTGLIIPLGLWVLRESCRQMREWQDHFPTHRDLTVSVNISGKQVAQAEFNDHVKRILAETGLEPRSLKLELTESAIVENIDMTIPMFNRLRELGVQIQIDDFGMGYSSLNYLSIFPINALKIGQSFISMMPDDESNRKIVNAIVMMTHGLGMGVIAEGVESKGQLDQLKELGCEYGQGYLISMPLDPGSVGPLLTKGFTGPLPPLVNDQT